MFASRSLNTSGGTQKKGTLCLQELLPESQLPSEHQSVKTSETTQVEYTHALC